jgi:putative intracellular protease/amidase
MSEMEQAEVVADHHMRVDAVSSTPKKVLIVVANPSTSTTMGWPVGFWGAELTHPYYELTERGVEVTIASPAGGKVEMDSLSEPRDQSKWSSEDLITMGFVNTPERHFYESEKPTAVYCHGTAALVDLKLSDGSYLVKGKTVTGFANVEEEFSDTFVGQKVMPWRVEDVLRERGANYVQGGLFKAFAVRDGRLITGQQQYSGRRVAQMVIEALGV